MDRNRITILDGFRVIAIVMVLLFHFYERFQNEFYYYDFGYTEMFSFGKLGVEFFFIISGFVITLTLGRCSNFFEFLKKRLIRLIPAMIVCSVITFTILNIFDTTPLFPASHKISNLLLSNTFISPKFINLILSTDLHYIDSAYWSLWVELSFYVVVSILYFLNKDKLLRNYAIFTFCALLFHYVFITSVGKGFMITIIDEKLYLSIRELVHIFHFLSYSTWFLLGIILYELYNNKRKKNLILFTIVFIIQMILMTITVQNFLFMVFIYALLMFFIYKPAWISFLGNKFFSKLGLVSYSVYLIHQNIGVLIINKMSPYFGSYNWIIGVVLIALSFSFGLFSYSYLEKSISKNLKKIMF